MSRWPQRAESERLGCTCQWYGEGAIAEFDLACPIGHRHRAPGEEMEPRMCTQCGDVDCMEDTHDG